MPFAPVSFRMDHDKEKVALKPPFNNGRSYSCNREGKTGCNLETAMKC